MVSTRRLKAAKAKKQANNPGSLRRRRSMRLMLNVAYRRDPTLRPIYLLPMDTRHVRWLSTELYKWFFQHIWDRTYVQGINHLHQLVIQRWPQYGFYEDDPQLQKLLDYTRKEVCEAHLRWSNFNLMHLQEIREWMHRHAAMEMNYKGEFAREVSDLGRNIAIEEYDQGFTDGLERDYCGAEEFFYQGVLYKFSKSRYIIKREIEGSFSLNKLLYSGIQFTEDQLAYLGSKRDEYIGIRDLHCDPDDEQFWDLIRKLALSWSARWAPPLYITKWNTEERAAWRRAVILKAVHILDLESRSVRGMAKLLKKLRIHLAANSNWLYKVDDRAAQILNLPPSYTKRDQPRGIPAYLPRYFPVIEASCTLRVCTELDWEATVLRSVHNSNMTRGISNP
ncbi:hypothetical protein VNI00_017727 [Paramarasmius palmivorus]|uniref:Uncharacterized protein n=1 Tax=Paramarasmius palmivorus TaxID=297713 RepID=A0AAW0B5E9_9AGAR